MRFDSRRALLTRFTKFLLVGGTTVLIDALIYAVLVGVGVHSAWAKPISFAAGAVFAYFANWRFTFGARRSRWSEVLFVAVYLSALAVNTAVNEALLVVLERAGWAYVVAFLVSTGISAVWNFAGMSLFVFRGSTPQHGAQEQQEDHS